MPEKPKLEGALSFLRLASSGKVSEAFERYVVRTGFRHHNPYFPGDADSLKKGMMEAHQKFPHTTFEVIRVFESEDYIAVHSRVVHATDQPEIAVVHIFAFSRDRISELWDVGVQAPKDSPNENGLF